MAAVVKTRFPALYRWELQGNFPAKFVEECFGSFELGVDSTIGRPIYGRPGGGKPSELLADISFLGGG
jgi:hypothetical protein